MLDAKEAVKVCEVIVPRIVDTMVKVLQERPEKEHPLIGMGAASTLLFAVMETEGIETAEKVFAISKNNFLNYKALASGDENYKPIEVLHALKASAMQAVMEGGNG